MKQILKALAAFLVLGIASNAHARLQDKGWVFTPFVGVNRPNIDVILQDVYGGSFNGLSEITTDLPADVAGESSYPTEPFNFENYLEPQNIGIETGFEVSRNFGTKVDFFMGVGSWEVSSQSFLTVTFPIQGDRKNEADYERRGKFSYTQYYIGARRFWFERSRPFNMYFNFALHELFDIDYKENHVFRFRTGKPAGFSRNYILTSQTTGLMLLQLGAGMEYRFADRFSASLEGAYSVSIHPGNLRSLGVKEDFNRGDRVTQFPDYLTVDPTTQNILVKDSYGEKKELKLEMSGWRALVKINIAF